MKLFPILLLFAQASFGQVTGKVTNSSNQSLAFATISLLTGDSIVVQTVVTDSTGLFLIQGTQQANYLLKISCIGYETYYIKAVNTIGTVVLKPLYRDLESVEVRSVKPLITQQSSGIIINVENSLINKGNSVLQVLERSPGVIIDHQNGDISLNGKGGVMVMLNGKLLRMSLSQVVQMLEGMSSDDISRIELLTTPPAGYDAEGSAGLINIVTKQNRKKGTNGSATGTGGYGRYGEKSSGNMIIAHNSGKLHFNSSYSINHNRSGYDIYITGSKNMPFLGGQSAGTFNNNTKQVQNSHDLRTEMEIQVTPATTLGASIGWNNSRVRSTNHNRSLLQFAGDSVLSYDGIIKGGNQWDNLVSSVYFDNKYFHTSLDYLWYHNDNPTNIDASFVNKDGNQAGTGNDTLYAPLQRGFGGTTIRVAVGKLDYNREFKRVKIEAGIKGTYTTVASSAGIQSLVNGAWINRSESVSEIRMQEPIAAAYASVNTKLSATINLTAGARYEYARTQIEGKDKTNNVDRRLGVLFPTIFLTKTINDESEWQFSWTKRISRPNYNDLASFISYADPTAVFTGNPYLKPTITNNIKIGYNYKQYIFSLLYSDDKNPIARYMLTESPGRELIFVSPQNLAWQRGITLLATVPVTIAPWWNMSYTLTGGWKHHRVIHTKEPAEKAYWNYLVNFSQNFVLPHNFSIELSGWLTSDWYSATIKGDGFGSVNGGIKKNLKNNKGSLQLSVADIFCSLRIHSYFGAVGHEAFDNITHVRFNAESRNFPTVRLSYSRLFGKSSSKTQRAVDGEERDRVRKE